MKTFTIQHADGHCIDMKTYETVGDRRIICDLRKAGGLCKGSIVYDGNTDVFKEVEKVIVFRDVEHDCDGAYTITLAEVVFTDDTSVTPFAATHMEVPA